jgi:hypothetical protein
VPKVLGPHFIDFDHFRERVEKKKCVLRPLDHFREFAGSVLLGRLEARALDGELPLRKRERGQQYPTPQRQWCGFESPCQLWERKSLATDTLLRIVYEIF